MIGTQSKRFAMQHDIELTELRKHGTSNTTSRSTTTQIPLVTQSFHSDAKLGTATATRLTRAEGPRSINFPAKVLSTSRNKFARQALHVTCFFGIMTVVYEAVSLIPPFTTQVIASEALTLQASSSEEEIGLAKLAVVYDFLQECTDRKSQDLPLGPDCEKYREKAPKAPPDIDKYMEDLPSEVPKTLPTSTPSGIGGTTSTGLFTPVVPSTALSSSDLNPEFRTVISSFPAATLIPAHSEGLYERGWTRHLCLWTLPQTDVSHDPDIFPRVHNPVLTLPGCQEFCGNWRGLYYNKGPSIYLHFGVTVALLVLTYIFCRLIFRISAALSSRLLGRQLNRKQESAQTKRRKWCLAITVALLCLFACISAAGVLQTNARHAYSQWDRMPLKMPVDPHIEL